MNSQASDSEQNNQSSAFFLLSEKVQRWIWEQGWNELRDAQEKAIAPILAANTDVIISASTASGKTEAAFLPICSSLANESISSIAVLYISPLKALINDQFERLSAFCERLDIHVFKWHGDVSSGAKRKFLANPSGILLITPESLEALFILHGTAIKPLFNNLRYIVVDELHSFIGSERGRQLQSLMHRIDTSRGRRSPRIGLSATIGDMQIAAKFLRSHSAFPCLQIVSSAAGQEILLQIRGYLAASKANPSAIAADYTKSDDNDIAVNSITDHLFTNLRGSTNLVFTNSRALTEVFSSKLRSKCENENLPLEFWPHHGSLSKQLREETEFMLKDKSKPTTAICTATLEMGIDIGSVKSIAQIGCPPSVSSMRQRLGRSGRRGEPSIMRIYIQELEISAESAPQDSLRAELFQTIAMVNLLLRGWCETPNTCKFHFSTLVQQVLSMICQYGAIDALRTYRVLCETGVFDNVSQPYFAELLREIGNHNLITQAPDSTLILGWEGEKLVNNYDFYSAFSSPEEYKLFAEGANLGTIPLMYPPTKDMFLIFAGRLWQITSVDEDRLMIYLKPAKSGKPPKFFGTGGLVSDEIRKEMFSVYANKQLPKYLDTTAIKLFSEGARFFSDMNLLENRLLTHGKNSVIFPWSGDSITYTIFLLLLHSGCKVENDGFTITALNMSIGDVRLTFEELLKDYPSDPVDIIKDVKQMKSEKHDQFIGSRLLQLEAAARNIELEGARKSIERILE